MILRGIILDLDGVLVDSELWSWQAHDAVLAQYGHPPLTLEEVRRLVGLIGEEEWAALRDIRPVEGALEEYQRAHTDAFIRARAGNLAPMVGVAELLDTVSRYRLRLALASNSPLHSIRETLEVLKITQFFDAVVSAEDVARAKPAPDIYELALRRLSLAPELAFAVEDSQVGIQAAQAAGLRCLAVPNDVTSAQNFAGAHRQFASLRDVARWLDDQLAN